MSNYVIRPDVQAAIDLAKVYVFGIVVDINGGGHYTSIHTAFTTEGVNKTYYIMRGSYTEDTADLQVPAASRVVFDDVSIDMGVYALRVSTAPVVLEGNVDIASTGIYLYRLDAESAITTNLTVTLDPTWVGGIATGVYIGASINCDKAFVGTIRAKNVTMDIDNGAQVYMVRTFGGSYNTFNGIHLNTIQNIGTRELVGLYLTGTSLENVVNNINVQSVTNTGGGNGVGVKTEAGSNENVLYGICRNCTTSQLVDSGANTFKTSFNYA